MCSRMPPGAWTRARISAPSLRCLPPAPSLTTATSRSGASICREGRNVGDLLRANHTYLNERVALHYGITDVKGDQFRRVELKDSTRWGLLGKGGILVAAASPNRTRP